MSIAQRKHNRLSVDIPVFRYTKDGERIDTLLYQVGIGGCLIAWDETLAVGDIFRMEVQLPNKNWLPLSCKVLYCFESDAIGVQFLKITQFEQDLLVDIMSNTLTSEGIPFNFDPFARPKDFRTDDDDEKKVEKADGSESEPEQNSENIFV